MRKRLRLMGSGEADKGPPPGPDRLYLNLSCINGAQKATSGLGPPIQFTDARAQNVVDDAAEYDLAIVRWSSTGLQLPEVTPLFDASSTDPCATAYYAGVSFDCVDSGEEVPMMIGFPTSIVYNLGSSQSVALSRGTITKYPNGDLASFNPNGEVFTSAGLAVGGWLAFSSTFGGVVTSVPYQITGIVGIATAPDRIVFRCATATNFTPTGTVSVYSVASPSTGLYTMVTASQALSSTLSGAWWPDTLVGNTVTLRIPYGGGAIQEQFDGSVWTVKSITAGTVQFPTAPAIWTMTSPMGPNYNGSQLPPTPLPQSQSQWTIEVSPISTYNITSMQQCRWTPVFPDSARFAWGTVRSFLRMVNDAISSAWTAINNYQSIVDEGSFTGCGDTDTFTTTGMNGAGTIQTLTIPSPTAVANYTVLAVTGAATQANSNQTINLYGATAMTAVFSSSLAATWDSATTRQTITMTGGTYTGNQWNAALAGTWVSFSVSTPTAGIQAGVQYTVYSNAYTNGTTPTQLVILNSTGINGVNVAPCTISVNVPFTRGSGTDWLSRVGSSTISFSAATSAAGIATGVYYPLVSITGPTNSPWAITIYNPSGAASAGITAADLVMYSGPVGSTWTSQAGNYLWFETSYTPMGIVAGVPYLITAVGGTALTPTTISYSNPGGAAVTGGSFSTTIRVYTGYESTSATPLSLLAMPWYGPKQYAVVGAQPSGVFSFAAGTYLLSPNTGNILTLNVYIPTSPPVLPWALNDQVVIENGVDGTTGGSLNGLVFLIISITNDGTYYNLRCAPVSIPRETLQITLVTSITTISTFTPAIIPYFTMTSPNNLALVRGVADCPRGTRIRGRILMNEALYAMFSGFDAYAATSNSTTWNGYPCATHPEFPSLGAPAAALGSSSALIYTINDDETRATWQSPITLSSDYAYRPNTVPVLMTYTTTSPALYITPQLFSCTDAWSDVASICFLSQMQIQAELQSPPNTGVGFFTPIATVNQSNTMTDMTLDLAGGCTDWLNKIVYNPSAEYRWTTLHPGPVQSASFQVYWRSRSTNQLYQVTLAPGGSIEVKLLFQRKGI